MSSKSTFSNTTSKSYAIALYELSKENSELDRIELEVKNIQKLINESFDFKEKKQWDTDHGVIKVRFKKII